MSGAIWQAYSDCGSLEVTCPNCAARPGQWCTKPDGRVRRVPCVERAAAGGMVIDPTNHHDRYRDFSEPTHPPTD